MVLGKVMICWLVGAKYVKKAKQKNGTEKNRKNNNKHKKEQQIREQQN